LRFDQVGGGVTSEKWEFFFVGLAVGSFKPEGQSKWRREEKFSLERELARLNFRSAVFENLGGLGRGPIPSAIRQLAGADRDRAFKKSVRLRQEI